MALLTLRSPGSAEPTRHNYLLPRRDSIPRRLFAACTPPLDNPAPPPDNPPMPLMPPFSITVCGIEELPGHCTAGVTHVLSILNPDAPVPPAFGTFAEHRRLELRFLDVIEAAASPDPPQAMHVAELLAFGRGLALGSSPHAHLLVHCHAGISRSSAAMLLILAQAQPAVQAADLAQQLLDIRAKAWPNLRMLEFGDPMLDRRGTLIQAAAGLYRHQLQERPHLADVMTANGRAREVAAAGQSVRPS